MSISAEINLSLHERQAQALQSEATEILYGGAAGGGKSWLMRAAAIIWCAAIPGLQVYIFRRVFDDLIKNHMEGRSGFRAILAPWVQCGLVKIVETEIRFWNGAKIYLCHCQHDDDRWKYQGAEIDVLMVDELTHFTEIVYRFLRSRCRSSGITIPPEWAGRFPRALNGSNPGNIGHGWVKEMFVDAGPWEIYRASAEEGGMLRQYIPARLCDNPSIAIEDPGYEGRLSGLGSPQLVKAMKDGDWMVIAGAYFQEIGAHHSLEPCELPAHWTRFRSIDWGSAKPFSVGWWAVCDGTTAAGHAFTATDGLGRIIMPPRGSLIRYREWYGKQTANVGLKMRSEEVAAGILSRTAKGEEIAYTIADPAMFQHQDGPSVAENMFRAGLSLRPGDNKRVPGWQQMRDRLIGDEEGPRLFVFRTCLDWWRTVPILQHDDHKIEDVNSDLEDHAGDECRLACMSRPFLRERPKPQEPMRDITRTTLNELWQMQEEDQQQYRRI